MCISVRTCAYITHLLLAAIYYTKHLSFCDWMRGMFHPMTASFRSEPAQRKWSFLKNQRCFPPPPKKKNRRGRGNREAPKKKKTFQNSTERERSFHHRPPKSRHKKLFPGLRGCGSWGCGTCKSCSKGFSAKRSSSSSSWKCGCKDKNDAMLVIMMRYDEV